MATKPKLQESYENPELASRLQRYRDRSGEYSNKRGGASFTVPEAGKRTGVSREEAVRRERAYAERRRGSATERNSRSQQRSRNEGTQQQRSSRGTQRVDSSRGGQRPVSNYSPTPQTQGMGRPQSMQAQPYSQRPIPRPAMGYGDAAYMNNPAPQRPMPSYAPTMQTQGIGPRPGMFMGGMPMQGYEQPPAWGQQQQQNPFMFGNTFSPWTRQW